MSFAGLIRRLLLAFAIFVLGMGTAMAAPVKLEHMEAQLVSQGEAVPGGETWVAIHQKLEPGWHTYWRNSGDAGEPTAIKWTLPPGWKAGEIVWPAPKRIRTSILMNYGYEGEVLLPIAITAPASARAGETVTLKGIATFMVCADVCIPTQASLTLDVTVAGAAPVMDAKWAPAITRTLEVAPRPAGLAAAWAREGDTIRLSVTGEALKGAETGKAYFYPFVSTLIDHPSPQPIEKGPEGLTLTLKTAPSFKPGPLSGVLALGDRVFEVTAAEGAVLAGATGGGVLPPAPEDDHAAGGAAPSEGLPGLLKYVAFAFLGGLILNLMPCVFPVLSMKASALARHAHDPGAARKEGLAFLAGVLVTFLTLAGVLIAAKAGGEAVGWGFQLQSPPMVAGLSILMLLIALNLSGLFEIGLSVQGVGSGLASKSGLAGAFFTGALAAVVAAPCMAPLMGVAIGYALGQPAAVALLVFTGLGLGFGLPFTALAFAPALLRRLPRPGPWMGVFKSVLAFPMYGAVAWLVWVFTVQAGTMALPVLLACAVVIAFAAWLFGLGQRAEGGRKIALQLVLPLVLVASAIVLAPVAKTQTAPVAGAETTSGGLTAEPWSEARVAQLRAQGKVVFVDFTAAWCVTCQVNEKTSLSSASVADAFSKANAVFLKGDWTNRDAAIAAVLKRHGRAGVPLYLVYPAGGGEPEVLPQLLTEGIVKAALARAAKA